MPLFKNIEKLINEHGSSLILKERLELAADKYDKLESDLEAAREENTTLKALTKELKKRLEAAEGASARPDKRSKEEENILTILANLGNHWPTADELCQRTKSSLTKVKYFIDRLHDAGLVHPSLSMGSPAEYFLSDKGRAYVVENDLVE